MYNNCSESHILGMQLNITTRPYSWVLIGMRPSNLVDINQDIVVSAMAGKFSLDFYEYLPCLIF